MSLLTSPARNTARHTMYALGIIHQAVDIQSILLTLASRIALKRLLRQTLSHDEELIDVHPLASLILSEGVRLSAGSSIKTDGEESDPWGILAVIDVARNRVRSILDTRFSADQGRVTQLSNHFSTTLSLPSLRSPPYSHCSKSRPRMLSILQPSYSPFVCSTSLYRSYPQCTKCC